MGFFYTYIYKKWREFILKLMYMKELGYFGLKTDKVWQILGVWILISSFSPDHCATQKSMCLCTGRVGVGGGGVITQPISINPWPNKLLTHCCGLLVWTLYCTLFTVQYSLNVNKHELKNPWAPIGWLNIEYSLHFNESHI